MKIRAETWLTGSQAASFLVDQSTRSFLRAKKKHFDAAVTPEVSLLEAHTGLEFDQYSGLFYFEVMLHTS